MNERRIIPLCLGGALLAVTALAVAQGQPAQGQPAQGQPAQGQPTQSPEAGKKAFLEVVSVLQSPRCVNCHPSGDAPMQGDRPRRHAMNVSRASVEAGLACNTCHQERNSEAIGVPGGPPGAPHWGLPEKAMPLVFEGLTPSQLCEQLKDPARNGHRDAAALVEHVSHDPLILWGWQPGGKRTKPPISHEAFVASWKTWTAANQVCP